MSTGAHFYLLAFLDLGLSYVPLQSGVSKGGSCGFSLIELCKAVASLSPAIFSWKDSVILFWQFAEAEGDRPFRSSFKGPLEGKDEAEPWLCSSHWLVTGQL